MTEIDPGAGDMRARILDTAEGLLRRHGLEKLTVVDVARALNMSHGNVYRHIPSKAALRAEVVQRWLDRIADQIEAVARGNGPADARLRQWLLDLAVVKQRKILDDVEMLAAAATVVKDSPQVEENHSRKLRDQVAHILRDGMEEGTFRIVPDVQSTAAAILNATYRYHHPNQVARGGSSKSQLEALEAIISLIIAGLRSA